MCDVILQEIHDGGLEIVATETYPMNFPKP